MIKMITIEHNKKIFKKEFKEGINWIIARGHQFGKSTIINSIMYAIGADFSIFDGAEKKPTGVLINIDDHLIFRSETTWTLDSKSFKKIDLNKLFTNNFPKIRSPYGTKSVDFLNLIVKFWCSQRKVNGNDNFKLPKENDMGNKDMDSFLSGFDVEKLVELSEQKLKFEKENKIINNTIKLDSYIGNIEKIPLDQVDEYLKINDKYKKVSKKLIEVKKRMHQLNKIITSHESDSEYIAGLKSYLDSIDKYIKVNGEQIKLDLWNLLGEELIDGSSSVSIEKYKFALKENQALSEQIKLLLFERNNLDLQASNLDIEISLKHSVIRGLIADSSYLKNKLKNTSELTKQIGNLKKIRKIAIENHRENIAESLKTYRVKPSPEGLGQIMRFLVDVSLYQERYLPQFILLDSVEEVASQINGLTGENAFLSNVIPTARQLKGQVLITYTDTNGKYDSKTKEENQIFLNGPIFKDDKF